MTQIDHFDLVVIGAGPAGEKGAAQAAYFGKRVCVVERAPKPGGAAVNTGTIPSKTLRETALSFAGLRQRALQGIDYQVRTDVTLADFMHRERDVVERAWTVIEDNFQRHGITTIQGTARFVNPRMIEITRFNTEPRRISADQFLVATGSLPDRPDAVPFDGEHVVDSDMLLTLPRIPRSMIVVGGGAVGCEYACTFAALGTRVTLLNDRERLLTHVDADVSEALRQQMTARLGISVVLDTAITAITSDHEMAHVTLTDGTILGTDCVLYSAGRLGNTVGLGLATIGVQLDERGFVLVDERFRTAVPHVYAAGDVIGYPALASTAMEQARVAVCDAFDLRYKERVASVLPYAVHSWPEIAMVGETEETARAQGITYEIGCARFRGNPRGQIVGETDGFVKLIFRPEDRRLLGAAIIGEQAAELIHVAMTVLAFEGAIDYFIQSVFNYPTLADTYKYAAYDGLQRLQRRLAQHRGLPSSGGYRTVG